VLVAYADPPYLGKCGKFYKHEHPDGRCWDDIATHELLVKRLEAEYPDGWALSLSSPSLQDIFKKGVRPAYAWEPVLFRGGRNIGHPPPVKGGAQTTPKDYVAVNITLRRGLTGAKPPAFCEWVLDLLNVQPGDVVDDLFPGTGIMGTVAAARTA
jgi:hypothetical protein